MAKYKLEFLFEFQGYGWSEVWYAEKPNATMAMASLNRLKEKRRILLGGVSTAVSPWLKALRVSDVDLQRDSLVEHVPYEDGRGEHQLGNADNPNLCVNVRVESGDKYRRTWYLRGQPDLICREALYRANPPWPGQLAQFLRMAIGEGWSILAVEKPTTMKMMASVTNTADDTILVITTEPHGLEVNDTVRIVSSPGVKGFRGVKYVIVKESATSFQVAGQKTGNYIGGGKFYKRTYTLQPIDGMQVNKITRRATGRPTDAPVGRRRRRATA